MFHQNESVDISLRRDKQKIEDCKSKGVTLIEVPYWWDRKPESLAASIYNVRPDLFEVEPQGKPIPLNPPTKSASKTNSGITCCYHV